MFLRRSLLRAGVPLLAVATAAALASPAGAAGDDPIPGFTDAHARAEHAYEKAFSAIPDTHTAQRLDKYLSAEPGLVASSGDYRRVRYIAKELRSYGLKAQIKTYYTYVSHPRSVRVRQTAPETRDLPVKEEPRPWQKDFGKVVDGYNALSPSGDVTGDVVYANYGNPALNRLNTRLRKSERTLYDALFTLNDPAGARTHEGHLYKSLTDATNVLKG